MGKNDTNIVVLENEVGKLVKINSKHRNRVQKFEFKKKIPYKERVQGERGLG